MHSKDICSHEDLDQWVVKMRRKESVSNLTAPDKCLLKWLKENRITGSDLNDMSIYAKTPDKTNIENVFENQFGMPGSHQRRLESLLKDEDSPQKRPLAVNTSIQVDEGSDRIIRRTLNFAPQTADTHSKDEQAVWDCW